MPDPITIGMLGLSALGAINSGRKQGKANDLNERAVKLAENDYNQRAPLRQAFLEYGLRDIPEAPDLSAAFADPSNPFSSAGGGRLPQVGRGDPLAGIDRSQIPQTQVPAQLAAKGQQNSLVQKTIDKILQEREQIPTMTRAQIMGGGG